MTKRFIQIKWPDDDWCLLLTLNYSHNWFLKRNPNAFFPSIEIIHEVLFTASPRWNGEVLRLLADIDRSAEEARNVPDLSDVWIRKRNEMTILSVTDWFIIIGNTVEKIVQNHYNKWISPLWIDHDADLNNKFKVITIVIWYIFKWH